VRLQPPEAPFGAPDCRSALTLLAFPRVLPPPLSFYVILPRDRFWSQVLTQRSALELSEGVYEVRGGVAAAEKAGAAPKP
jgi:hypothetical protein